MTLIHSNIVPFLVPHTPMVPLSLSFNKPIGGFAAVDFQCLSMLCLNSLRVVDKQTGKWISLESLYVNSL